MPTYRPTDRCPPPPPPPPRRCLRALLLPLRAIPTQHGRRNKPIGKHPFGDRRGTVARWAVVVGAVAAVIAGVVFVGVWFATSSNNSRTSSLSAPGVSNYNATGNEAANQDSGKGQPSSSSPTTIVPGTISNRHDATTHAGNGPSSSAAARSYGQADDDSGSHEALNNSSSNSSIAVPSRTPATPVSGPVAVPYSYAPVNDLWEACRSSESIFTDCVSMRVGPDNDCYKCVPNCIPCEEAAWWTCAVLGSNGPEGGEGGGCAATCGYCTQPYVADINCLNQGRCDVACL